MKSSKSSVRRQIGKYTPGRVGFLEYSRFVKVGDEILCNMVYRDYTRSRPKHCCKLHILRQDLTKFEDLDLPFVNHTSFTDFIRSGSLCGVQDVRTFRPGDPMRIEAFIERAIVYIDDKERIYLKAKYRRYSPISLALGYVPCFNRLIRFYPDRNIFKDRSLVLHVHNTDILDAVDRMISLSNLGKER